MWWIKQYRDGVMWCGPTNSYHHQVFISLVPKRLHIFYLYMFLLYLKVAWLTALWSLVRSWAQGPSPSIHECFTSSDVVTTNVRKRLSLLSTWWSIYQCFYCAKWQNNEYHAMPKLHGEPLEKKKNTIQSFIIDIEHAPHCKTKPTLNWSWSLEVAWSLQIKTNR